MLATPMGSLDKHRQRGSGNRQFDGARRRRGGAFYGKAGSKKTASKNRKHEVMNGFDLMQVPPWAHPLKAPSQVHDNTELWDVNMVRY